MSLLACVYLQSSSTHQRHHNTPKALKEKRFLATCRGEISPFVFAVLESGEIKGLCPLVSEKSLELFWRRFAFSPRPRRAFSFAMQTHRRHSYTYVFHNYCLIRSTIYNTQIWCVLVVARCRDSFKKYIFTVACQSAWWLGFQCDPSMR